MLSSTLENGVEVRRSLGKVMNKLSVPTQPRTLFIYECVDSFAYNTEFADKSTHSRIIHSSQMSRLIQELCSVCS